METSQDDKNETIIHLHLCHNRVLLWKPSDIIHLRRNHRVIGSTIGCYPPKPRQNSHLGLPLQLTKIEAKFILENLSSVLCKVETKTPTSVDFDSFKERRRHLQDLQVQLKEKDKLEMIDSIAGSILEGKQKKQKKNFSFQNDEEMETNEECDIEVFKKEEVNKVHQLGIEQMWVKADQISSTSIEIQLPADSFQLSVSEELKYCVYKDLHSKGYYLTDGIKFGGDFLVYPGDPGLYHSMYIALCIHSDHSLSATDYAALGRLATSVKKTLLLCCVGNDKEVSFMSIAWSGVV